LPCDERRRQIRPRTIPVYTAWIRWTLASLASAAMAGCENPEFISEHPVENQIPPPKAGVYSIKAVDVRPVAIREIEPDYPPDLEPILTGKAVVVFTVRADGKVANASVIEADDVLFGEAAIAAVLKWRFHPAVVKGAPVDCRMTLTFVFSSPAGYYPQDEAMPDPSNGAPPGASHQKNIEQH